MSLHIHRRGFVAACAAALSTPRLAVAQGRVARKPGTHVRIGLNAYSFDKPLRDGKMTLEDAVDYCAQHNLETLDATGYYFPGYPQVPSDEAIYRLKRRAFVNGVIISGTGVRNDFALTDTARRKQDVRMVKEWIEAASKLGAPVIRIFTGVKVPEGHTFDQALEWMIPDLKECVEHGKRHGVVIGLQHHNDFARTAADVIRIVNAVNSEWFGVILDVGRLRHVDPYAEIEKLVPYAVSWQIKETVWYDEKQVPIDLPRIRTIIDKLGYRGNLPIETLGKGDPLVEVARFCGQVRQAFT